MTAPGILIGGTDLTRYDRTIDLESMGEFYAMIEQRGEDIQIPGLVGEIDGGRVAGARLVPLVIELVGTSAANTWPADPVAQWHTNLATLKSLLAGTFTLTLNPAGTTCLARCTALTPTMRADFWADVTLEFKLLAGTL